ncbi:MAG TPA: PH domain-containing protein [Nocardioides sp.]|nr:PH domain-containing protein [Nocardioides sp.]
MTAQPLGEPAWERLDPRMLLVHPIREVGRFVPVLLGLLVTGRLTDGPWALLGVGLPVSLGVVRYFTTRYRVTTDRVELSHGLLARHRLSTPIDRVRTVDLTATPIHRVLGLAALVVGTGSVATGEDNRIKLDSLPREQAADLRRRLLEAPHADGVIAQPLAPTETVVARFEPRWLWYAPFTSTVLVAIGAVFGAVSPYLGQIDLSHDRLERIKPLLITLAVAAPLLLVLLYVAAYLVTNGGFLLTRRAETWHVSRGLVTHRETSIDADRLAGVGIGEALPLRLARGRRLKAIVTGLRRSQESSTTLLPPTPRRTTLTAAAALVGSEAAVTGPLLAHGPRATTRRYTRALMAAAPVVAGTAIAVVAGAPAALGALGLAAVVLAIGLAADRARSLGHAHLEGHVVMRSGSLTRRREILGDSHVIGWNLRATWFQRRVGLVTVAATTAGGGGRIEVRDVPAADAVALARAATPGLLEEFLAG